MSNRALITLADAPSGDASTSARKRSASVQTIEVARDKAFVVLDGTLLRIDSPAPPGRSAVSVLVVMA